MSDKDKATRFSYRSLTLSQCKQQKELTFKFIIHSLEIKYQNHEMKEELMLL